MQGQIADRSWAGARFAPRLTGETASPRRSAGVDPQGRAGGDRDRRARPRSGRRDDDARGMTNRSRATRFPGMARLTRSSGFSAMSSSASSRKPPGASGANPRPHLHARGVPRLLLGATRRIRRLRQGAPWSEEPETRKTMGELGRLGALHPLRRGASRRCPLRDHRRPGEGDGDLSEGLLRRLPFHKRCLTNP